MTKNSFLIATAVTLAANLPLATSAFAQAFPGMMVHPQAAMTHDSPPPEDSSMAPAPMPQPQPQAPMAAAPQPMPAPAPVYAPPAPTTAYAAPASPVYAAPAPAPKPYVFPPAYNPNATPIQVPAPPPVVISAPTPAPATMPMMASKPMSAPVPASSAAEMRIKNLHDRLAIQPEQEHDWAPVAQAMRDYDAVMNQLVQKRRALGPTPTAAQNLASYQEMVAARAAGLKRISDAFRYLYANDMLPEQQGNADEVFASPGVMGQ